LDIAFATIALTASQALAADLPRKAPPAAPPLPPPPTWTGCYIGANVGGIFGRGDAHFNGFEIGSNERSGFTGGGHVTLNNDSSWFDTLTGRKTKVFEPSQLADDGFKWRSG
jgi:hypothetical protein